MARWLDMLRDIQGARDNSDNSDNSDNRVLPGAIVTNVTIVTPTCGPDSEFDTANSDTFINGDPHGPCIVCGHEITDADKPDCIPVSGPKGTPDRYLCPNLQCYWGWLRGCHGRPKTSTGFR